MDIKKELTTKEKIIRALEDDGREYSRMIGGFVGVLFATSIMSVGLSAFDNELSEINMKHINMKESGSPSASLKRR